MSNTAEPTRAPTPAEATATIARSVDDEIITGNQRVFGGNLGLVVAGLCILYTGFHIAVMNLYPLEPWAYRLIHVAGGLGLGFLLFAARAIPSDGPDRPLTAAEMGLLAVGGAGILIATGQLALMWATADLIPTGAPATKHLNTFGYPLIIGTVATLVASWIAPARNKSVVGIADAILALAAITVGTYIILHAGWLRTRAQVFPHPNDMWASVAGIILILELTRRLAGLALVAICVVFLAYGFLGPYLPGVLNHRGYAPARFFAFIYTDNGILGPTTAISSTYIILFITFAAFLQASRVGEYFVNFAFAAAGSARGGPAKVAVFASGLMGMINGTSAGNVVSTGSLTIPLMKKVGYKPQTAASVEAAASTGGQILPPIMGAGAFIMAEITAIPYGQIVIAAIIPAILYFVSVYFMVDKEALKKGMKGLPREELPRFDVLVWQAYLFIPIIVLIYALFAGYSVIRAGTLAMGAAILIGFLGRLHETEPGRQFTTVWMTLLGLGVLAPLLVVFWPGGWGDSMALNFGDGIGLEVRSESSMLYSIALGFAVLFAWSSLQYLRQEIRNDPDGPRRISGQLGYFRMVPYGLEIAARMSLQLVAVCAAAGIIVGVIALTGIGTRFSSLLLGFADGSPVLAMIFAMLVAIILGMGMPTTAAYAVAAAVIAPGLIRMGIPPLTAHFFIFYYAVISAITPPVALAAYAGAAIAQSEPMRTSVESFKFGLAAFIVPFMFFYSPEMLMQGAFLDILHVFVTALFGIYLMASAVQGWMFGPLNPALRVLALCGALGMIAGGWMSDLIGLAVAGLVFAIQRGLLTAKNAARGLD